MPALIFDLDGTLVDSVYEHVAAWHRAFAAHDVFIPAFEYHKRVGMTGTALVRAINEAFDLQLPDRTSKAIEAAHEKYYVEHIERATPVPGVGALWETLQRRRVRFAIATSSNPGEANVLLKKVDLPRGTVVISGEDAGESKPSPQIFAKAAEALGVSLEGSMIVGDAVWDMLSSRRAGALGIGVLTGGYGREELVAAGAYRVYTDVAEFARRLPEVGL
jgi:HAD superfamily hydrolase (TIGR01509 family)